MRSFDKDMPGEAATASSRRFGSPARSPRDRRVIPRLFCVLAQSAGMSSWVRTVNTLRKAAMASSRRLGSPARLPREKRVFPRLFCVRAQLDQCLGGHLPKRVFDSIIWECSVGSGLNRCSKLERKRSFRGDDPPLGVAVNVRPEFVERRRCRQQLLLFDPVRGSDERRLDHQQEECLVGQVVGSCGSDGDQHGWSSPRVSCTALGFILVGPDRSGFRCEGAEVKPCWESAFHANCLLYCHLAGWSKPDVMHLIHRDIAVRNPTMISRRGKDQGVGNGAENDVLLRYHHARGACDGLRISVERQSRRGQRRNCRNSKCGWTQKQRQAPDDCRQLGSGGRFIVSSD